MQLPAFLFGNSYPNDEKLAEKHVVCYTSNNSLKELVCNEKETYHLLFYVEDSAFRNAKYYPYDLVHI